MTDVGTVLPLDEARVAHEMLDGAPHKRGKIVLTVATLHGERNDRAIAFSIAAL